MRVLTLFALSMRDESPWREVGGNQFPIFNSRSHQAQGQQHYQLQPNFYAKRQRQLLLTGLFFAAFIGFLDFIFTL